MKKLIAKIGYFATKMKFFAVGPVFGVIMLLPGNVLAEQSGKILFEHMAFAKNIVKFAQFSENKSSKLDKVSAKIEGTIDIDALESYFISHGAPNTAHVAGLTPEDQRPHKIVKAVITAYTSTPDQTDDTPFIGASGKHVYDGMIAANWLPFGTKIKIPALYGDKVFTVDDRMNSRYGYGRMDIWLDTTKAEALKFGVKRVEIQIFYEEPKAKKLVVAK